MVKYCKCRCGQKVKNLYVSGHNFKNIAKTDNQKAQIGKAQKKAWDDGRRNRVVVGEKREINGRIKVRTVSKNGWVFWKNEDPYKKYREMSIVELTSLPPYTKSRLRKKGFEIPNLSAGVPRGYKQTTEHVEKRSKAMRKYLFDVKSGERFAKQRIRKSLEYRNWRVLVFSRDNWTCKKCGARSGNGKEVCLEAHHIKSFSKYPSKRFDVANGLTVCLDCHYKLSEKQMKGNKNGARLAT